MGATDRRLKALEELSRMFQQKFEALEHVHTSSASMTASLPFEPDQTSCRCTLMTRDPCVVIAGI
eukprot:6305591-Prorocentrum_lima.AAC.1